MGREVRFLHRFMRAIGFSKKMERKDLKNLLTDVIVSATKRSYTTNKEDEIIAEFSKDFANNIGIKVCGEFDDDDKFIYEYYFPYLRSSLVSSEEDISIERHASQESYAGVCDDLRVGVSLIFYLQNMIPYVKAQANKELPIKGTSLSLSGLSIKGSIMMPIIKNENDKRKVNKAFINRSQLIEAARKGDEDAIETLTLEDMDTYTAISKRIHKEDVFTLVDTYFMPYGVECDHYSILGEIIELLKVRNTFTNEEVYEMTVNCNDINIDVCINEKDLYGQPEVGRRFKGIVWLQGYINFPGDDFS